MSTPDFLQELAHQMRSQDNRCTSYPVYTVQEKMLITGIDTDYTERTGWFHAEGQQAEGEEAAMLEAGYQETGNEPEDWYRTGYLHRWEQVAAFFTLSAAENYIQANTHRHKGELRTYVESGYRNPEWKELRRLLSGPIQECVKALQEVTIELHQLHAHHYSDCQGGCPAHSYIDKAHAALDAIKTFKDPYR